MPRKTDYSQWDQKDLIAHIENWKSARNMAWRGRCDAKTSEVLETSEVYLPQLLHTLLYFHYFLQLILRQPPQPRGGRVIFDSLSHGHRQ